MAAPLNDNLANAETLVLDVPTAGNNAEATSETGEPAGWKAVWYKFTPSVDADFKVVVTPIQSQDVVLTLYSGPATGPTYSNITLLGSKDDGYTSSPEELIQAMVGGQTYYIEIRPYGSGAGGTFNLTVTQRPDVLPFRGWGIPL